MSSLDRLFYKEFTGAMKARASFKPLDINKIPVPNFNSVLVKSKSVVIRGIADDYFKKLNLTEAILFSRPKLKRRRYDSDGNFLKDSSGNILSTEVSVPRNCVAILSEVKLGVPSNYKSREDFEYVDFTVYKNVQRMYFIYIIPKKYCYKVNQTALVLSPRPLRSFYDGISLYLRSGHQCYLYIVPYNPTGSIKPYRVLVAKSSVNYNNEIGALLSYWENNNIIFQRSLTQFSEPVKERQNAGFQILSPSLSSESFIQFDYTKSMADKDYDIEATGV